MKLQICRWNLNLYIFFMQIRTLVQPYLYELVSRRVLLEVVTGLYAENAH
jgi:hypothetical protein